MGKHCWYIIEIVHTSRSGPMIGESKRDVDAVFCDSAQEAMEFGEGRNPIKLNQKVRVRKVTGFRDRQKAIELNEARSDQIRELRALCDA